MAGELRIGSTNNLTAKSMNGVRELSFYEMLLYFHDRCFYSVVRDDEGSFRIVSHKAPLGRLYVTAGCDTVELAKEQIGMSYALNDDMTSEENDWKIIDVINPFEIMGTGIKIGDKVRDELTGKEFEVYATKSGIQGNSAVRNHTMAVAPVNYNPSDDYSYIDTRELKPFIRLREDIKQELPVKVVDSLPILFTILKLEKGDKCIVQRTDGSCSQATVVEVVGDKRLLAFGSDLSKWCDSVQVSLWTWRNRDVLTEEDRKKLYGE